MSKLNHLIQLLAVAFVVLLSRPDTALAQLSFNPQNQVTLNIGGPGQTATAPNITVSMTNGSAISSLSISNLIESDGTNWLCPSAVSNTISISVGSGCGSTTSQLLVNTTYNGNFQVTANGNQTATVFVTLIVGNSGTTTNGLTTIPSQLSFSQSFAGQSVGSQTATAYFNGGVTNINNVTFTPISGPSGAITFASCFPSGSVVTCSLNGSATAQGTYTGTVSLSTASGGSIGVPITLTLGNGGTTSGLTVSPNPVNLYASTTGSLVQTVFANLNYNGQVVSPTSVSYSTSSGGSWLTAFVSGSQIGVAGSSNGLGIGTYTGTVTVSTQFYGTTSFQVLLNVGTNGGTTSGLSVSPNPVNLYASTTGAVVNSVTATVLYNGAQVTPTSVTYSTQSGGNWLQAFSNGSGGVTVNGFSTGLGNGTYSGTVTVSTALYGTTTFGANLNVGTSGSTSGLTASPNPVSLFSASPGSGVSAQAVSILYNGTQVTPSSVSFSTTTGQSWLQASIVGSQVQVTANTSFVGVGTYTGTVTVTTQSYGSTSFTVNLNVGTNGNSSGLVANPSSVNFSIPYGGGTSAQNVSIAYNGFPVVITSVNSNTNSTQNWLLVSTTSTGVMLSINGAALLQGTYNATVTVNTQSGIVTIPVNLSVGTGGGTCSSLCATPNPVTLSTSQVGGSVTPQTATITNNGSPVTISQVTASTTTGQAWLIPSVLSGNQVSVSANTSLLAAGSYSGTVIATTNFGTVQFLVNLTVGTTGTVGLTASPNPVTLVSSTTGGTVQAQTVSILYNGSPASITGIQTATNNGQSWLVASSLGTTVSVSANTGSLAVGVYTGTVTVNTTIGTTTFQVNLTVGSGGVTNSPLTASPNPVTFSESAAGQGGSQTITESYNGQVIPITNATFSPSDLFTSFVNVQVNSNGTVTLTLNNIATNPGTYTGTILLYSTYGNLNVPVTLQIGGTSVSGLVASPSSVVLNAPVGGVAQLQTVSITSNGSAVGITSLNTTTTTGQSWLVPTVGNSAVSIGVNTAGLLAGTYSGTVNVTTTVGLLAIPVTLTVGGSGGTTTGTGLQLGASALSFAYEIGQTAPATQIVSVASPGAQYFFTASPQSGTFLVVSNGSGNTPGNFSVSVNATGLAAGTYSGSISVTSSASSTPQTIPVTLVVSTTSLFQLTQSSVSFTAPLGSAQALSQNIQLNSTDAQSITFSASATSTGSWLAVTSATQTTPTTLTITANPVGLSQGTYTGTVTLTATNLTTVTNSPLTIPVTLIVGTGSGTGTGTGGLTAQPGSLSFAQAVNGGAPSSQTLSISGPTGFNYTAVASLSFGQNWLTVFPSNFTLPANLTISANGAGLGQGTYTGSILISAPGSTASQTIPVTLTVGGSTTVPVLTASPTSIAPFTFQTGGAAPAAQSIQISMSNGSATQFNASETTTSGGAWLQITPSFGNTPGSVTVSVNPTGLAVGSYSGTVTITGGGATPVNLPVTLTVTAPAVTTPTVVAIQNAASAIPTSLSPGLNVTIFGSNMGPSNLTLLQLGANGNVTTSLSGTQVTFDGVPAPIIYTKSTQVSVMVPYEIAGRATTSMVVSYNGVSSTPLSLRVVNEAPGIYSVNLSGTGQGAILNQNGSVNSSQNPDVVGDIIQIFMTGEGQTSPAGVDGAFTPGRAPFPKPVDPVTVQIGGITVPASDVTYAGEAPGLISGVMQVNAKIPAGAGSGNVSVVVQVGGVASQANITVAVR